MTDALDGDDGREVLAGEDFAAIIREHADDLHRYARHLTPDHALAQDLVQDTLVRAWERRQQFRGDASLRTWLHRILHNQAVDRMRRSNREISVDEVEARWRDDTYTVDAQAVVERAELRDELQDALVRVPESIRTPVVLHDVEGWTVREVAELLQISLPAAKQRLRRGRMSLVSALADGAERRRAVAGVPLRCWDARRHISDYLDGDLEPGITRQVEAHLQACPTCPPLYAALVGVHERLGQLRDPDSVIPDAILARLPEQGPPLTEPTTQPPRRRPP